jgi:hypothetical protein
MCADSVSVGLLVRVGLSRWREEVRATEYEG